MVFSIDRTELWFIAFIGTKTALLHFLYQNHIDFYPFFRVQFYPKEDLKLPIRFGRSIELKLKFGNVS